MLPEPLERLTKALVFYQEGDVLQLVDWAKALESLAGEEIGSDDLETARQLVLRALREGAAPDFIAQLTLLLDAVSQAFAETEVEALDADPWVQHGQAFVAEARHRLERAQELVLQNEGSAGADSIAELFRVFHTLKGEAGFLHRDDIVERAHGGEALLDELRSGRVWTREVADTLLADIDALAALLDHPGDEVSSEAGERSDAEVIRVSVDKLDALVNQVGELLVALDSSEGTASVKKLSRGLQQAALRLRTEPVRGLFSRLHRGARDLGRDLGKRVRVVLEGDHWEIDRQLLARLEEPLMHLIRNSLDHGIEVRSVRRARGKPDEGTLTLGARRRGNRMEISVSDDGGGLDAPRIWDTALARGLVEGPRPDDALVFPWIFHPGFSTATEVSKVSGRGVGMDVVNQTVQSSRGRIETRSTAGVGTTFTLSFPLSTAVLEGLVVRLGTRRFVVPVHSARESLKIDPLGLHDVGSGGRVYSLRGDLLPVFSLDDVLGQGPSAPVWGVVVEPSDGRRLIMLVEEVEAKREVVIRNLGARFDHLRGVSAATVLPGGGLALIVDVDQLADLAQVGS